MRRLLALDGAVLLLAVGWAALPTLAAGVLRSLLVLVAVATAVRAAHRRPGPDGRGWDVVVGVMAAHAVAALVGTWGHTMPAAWLRQAAQSTAVMWSAAFCYLLPRAAEGRRSTALPVDLVAGAGGLVVAALVFAPARVEGAELALAVQRSATLALVGLVVALAVVAAVQAPQVLRRPDVAGLLAAGGCLVAAYAAEVATRWPSAELRSGRWVTGLSAVAAAWSVVATTGPATGRPAPVARMRPGEMVFVATAMSVIPLSRLLGAAVGAPVSPVLGWLLLVLLRTMQVSTRTQRLSRRLVQVATTDPETGALSEWGLRRRLSDLLELPGPRPVLAVVAADSPGLLDHVLGGPAAAQVRRRMVDSLARHPAAQAVARLDGDQIAVVVRPSPDDDVNRLADDLRLVARSPAGPGETALVLDASVRLVAAPGAGTDATGLIALAYATDRATPGTLTDVDLAALRALPADLAAGRVTVRHRPVLALADGRLQASLVLPVQGPPTHGLVPLRRLGPAADLVGLSGVLGATVLAQAARDCATLRAAGHPLQLQVRVQPGELAAPGYPDAVLAELARHGLPPDALSLAVPATEPVVQRPGARGALWRLAGAGVQVCSLGLGGPSVVLEHLRALPLTRVGLDGELFAAVRSDPVHRAVADSAVGLARSLGLQVGVFDVPDAAGLALAVELGCQLAAGPAVAAPCTPDELAVLADDRRGRLP